MQRRNWNGAHEEVLPQASFLGPLGKLTTDVTEQTSKQTKDQKTNGKSLCSWRVPPVTTLRANFDTDVRNPARGSHFVNVFVAGDMNPIPARRATRLTRLPLLILTGVLAC